jgi:hypothetical protein
MKEMGVDSQYEKDLSPSQSVHTSLGSTQPCIQWVLGVLFLDVKWLVYEGDHVLPSGANVRDVWSCNSILSYCFKA